MDTDDLAALMGAGLDGPRFVPSDGNDTIRVYEGGPHPVIVFERTASTADVAVPLGPAPAGEALRALLEAGCGGAGTGAAAFALDGDELLLLARLDLAPMREADAQAALASLLAHAEFWAREGLPGPRAAPPAPDGDAMMIRL